MRGNAAGRMLAVEVRMGMSQRAAHALWEEHYGALAGWALAVLGDSDTARWVADEAKRAQPVLAALDAASAPRVRALALDEIFLGGGRPSSGSSP